MTPKEKAVDLLEKFESYVIRYNQDDVIGYLCQETPIFEYQRQCALIAVCEILDTIPDVEIHNSIIDYWQDVKQEINIL